MSASIRETRGALGAGNERALVLFLGALNHTTRPLDFLCLARHFPPAAAKFVMAGCGPLDRVVDREIVRTGLHHVHRVPFDPRPERLLAAADVVVVPTESGGWSRVVLEALALGRPVVTTARGPDAELIERTGGGVTVPRRADVNGLARGVRAMLARPPVPAEVRAGITASCGLQATLPRYEDLLRA